MAKYVLVGDVGGTNARLAVCDLENGDISSVKIYSALDNSSLEDVVRMYLAEHKEADIKHACIAIACPITGDTWL